MANRPSVPKFGTWDSENVGYTVYFEKVRENKGSPKRPPFNPNDPQEAAAPNKPRPASSSGGQRASQHKSRPAAAGQHRRDGSGGSDRGTRGSEQSKFAPPQQYSPRVAQQQPPARHGGGQQYQPPSGHGGDQRAPPPARHKQVAPRAAASPQYNMPTPGRQRPSAVPRFGVWEEQNASVAQGFTVQFEKVKRERDVARGTVPDVPRMPSPEPVSDGRRKDGQFFSKVLGCFQPTTRQ